MRRGSDDDLDLAHRLGARLYPLALGVAVLIGVLPPLTWYVVKTSAQRRTAVLYARELAEDLRKLILPNPVLWKYEAQKYSAILGDFLPDKSVTAIRVLDDAGRPVTEYQHGSWSAPTWTSHGTAHGSAPLVFNDRRFGAIEVQVADPSLLRQAFVILTLSCVVGAGLALFMYRVPVRVAVSLERQVRDLVAVKGVLLDRLLYAHEEERRRIARELHDEAGQALTSLSLELQALESAESLAEVRTRTAELRRRAAEIMEDLHKVVWDLRPALLDDLGLVPAVENYAKACESGAGIRVDVVSQGLDGVRLAPRTEITLYRAIQEGLTNVIKHAQARVVSVLVERREENVVAVVEDDGCGFDPARKKETPGRGLGLIGIAERAALLGGASVVESRPGGGTTLVVTLPWAGVE